MRLHVGKRSWLINHSLTKLEQELDPECFVRLHRGAILRRSFIVGLRNDDHHWLAQLADGSEQRIGRAYAENARKLSGRGRPGR
jgi:DNA-binding LytR/AlgR family response regulator